MLFLLLGGFLLAEESSTLESVVEKKEAPLLKFSSSALITPDLLGIGDEGLSTNFLVITGLSYKGKVSFAPSFSFVTLNTFNSLSFPKLAVRPTVNVALPDNRWNFKSAALLPSYDLKGNRWERYSLFLVNNYVWGSFNLLGYNILNLSPTDSFYSLDLSKSSVAFWYILSKEINKKFALILDSTLAVRNDFVTRVVEGNYTYDNYSLLLASSLSLAYQANDHLDLYLNLELPPYSSKDDFDFTKWALSMTIGTSYSTQLL